MNYYFRLQWSRAMRFSAKLGFQPWLSILLGGGLFLFVSHILFYKIEWAAYAYSVMAVYSIYLLSTSETVQFIKTLYSPNHFLRVRAVENLLVTLPFFFFLLAKGYLIHGLILLIIAVFMSGLSSRAKSHFVIKTPFYAHPFEFVVGFRKTIWILVPLFVVIGIAIYVDNFNLAMVVMALSLLVPTSYYSQPEERFYVWTHAKNPIAFLKYKLTIGLVQWSALHALQALILLLFFTSQWWIILIMVVLGALLLVMSILVKYAYYPQSPDVFQGFVLVGCVVFPPLALVLVPILFKKATQNLSVLLC